MTNDQWYWYQKIMDATADGKSERKINEIIEDMEEELSGIDAARVLYEIGYDIV